MVLEPLIQSVLAHIGPRYAWRSVSATPTHWVRRDIGIIKPRLVVDQLCVGWGASPSHVFRIREGCCRVFWEEAYLSYFGVRPTPESA